MGATTQSELDAGATIGVRTSDTGLDAPRGPVEPPATAGTQLGRYLVIAELGFGAMGVVLRAYDPKLQREVALKLVRTGRLDDSAQARLVREARAMARLSHPNVVAVYDVELDLELGGARNVCLVMEFVPGTTLREWLDATPRPWAQVVAALCAAGRGLVAAHAQGLLHRDFKLDNVLVETDEAGDRLVRVRVTDFGLARATEDGPWSGSGDAAGPSGDARWDTGTQQLTVAGTVMGTPIYMAPEQMQDLELDPRADQYAFCVALWRGLTGRWPFRAEGLVALRDAKLDGPPRWPSDATAPPHVVAAIERGLRPDPARRWPSLEALIAELERDPRGRRRVAGLAVLGAAVALGAWGWHRVSLAGAEAACAAEGARITEVYDAARADATAEAFAATEIAYAPDTWTRARARLDEFGAQWTAARRDACLAADVARTLDLDLAASTRACLDEQLAEVGALMDELAEPDDTLVQKAATATASLPRVETCTDETSLRQRPELPDDPDRREAIEQLRGQLAQAAAAERTGRYERAKHHAEAVIDGARRVDWPPLQARALIAVGRVASGLGEYEDSRRRLEDAYFVAGEAGADDLALSAASSLVLVVGYHLARHDEALHWYRVAQMLIGRLDLGDDLAQAQLLGHVAPVYDSQRRLDEALDAQRRSLQLHERLLGPEHPGIAVPLGKLANIHVTRGEYDEARVGFARVLEIQRATLGPDHPELARTYNNLANVHYQQGNYAEATAYYWRAIDLARRALSPQHPMVGGALSNLGLVYAAQGAALPALRCHEWAREVVEASYGPDHPRRAMAHTNLAQNYLLLGAFDEATRHQLEALAIGRRGLGDDHPNLVSSYGQLGDIERAQGEYTRAREYYEQGMKIVAAKVDPHHPDRAELLFRLGVTRAHLRDFAGAAEALEEALQIYRDIGFRPGMIATTQFALARTYLDGDLDRGRARAFAEDAIATLDATGAPPPKRVAEIEAWIEASFGDDAR